MGEYLDFSIEWLGIVREPGLPFFADGRGHDVSARLRDPWWRQRYLQYDGSGGVITVSCYSREASCASGGLLPECMWFLVALMCPRSRFPGRRRIPCNAPVGRMAPQKAPTLLPDSFRRAADRLPQQRLDFIGDGPLLSSTQKFVRAFRLEDKVQLKGSQSNQVLEAMQRADIFFCSTASPIPNAGDQEGLPVSILEAIAQSLPVVSTREAGIPEAVDDGSTGFLVEPGDTKAMADSDRRSGPRPGSPMSPGAAEWKRAQDHFSWEREHAEVSRLMGLTPA